MVAGTYTIAYNANGGSGTMNNETGIYSFEGHTLPASTFTAPSGYQFAGWCTTNTAGSYACDGTSYAAGASVDGLASAGGTVTLYAYWKAIVWFQTATSADCGSEMHDNRGVDAYKDVAYTTTMINGLCWMTRNLDLPGHTTLTSSDSNVASNYTLPASSTSGFSDNTTAYVYNSNTSTFNDTSCGSSNPCYSYYSYVAATAGTNPSSGSANYDICPKGWRLPTQAEYNTLRGSYTTGAALTGSPFLGVYAGYYNSNFANGGSYGNYWSSTVTSSTNAYGLGYSGSNSGVYNFYKSNGYSVRCVLSE
jgi:uncharacterized protein (TIGR02145 family)